MCPMNQIHKNVGKKEVQQLHELTALAVKINNFGNAIKGNLLE